ncbi:MAG: hypothetical protein NTY35_01505 [Planctomycetota bacterium]|nr:hypothetical protein [Planctomycetota bacterium]
MDWLPDNVGGLELALVLLAALTLFAGEIEDFVRRLPREFRGR